MNAPRVSFAPRLAAMIRKGNPSNTGPSQSRAVILGRIATVSLLVVGLGMALHFGTASHRDAQREARIREAIATSGVASSPAVADGSERHE